MTSPLTYVARHLQALLGALGHLLRQPLGTLLSIAVISLALTLPACLYLLVKNARAATGSITDAIELTVYLKTDVSLERARQLADSARARREAGRVTLISADEGLAEFRKYSGFGAALEALQGNPLPHVISLRPRSDRADPSSIASLQRYLGSWPEADIVQVDNEWVRRLSALLGLLERVFQVFAALLAFGVLAIIGNAIRLEISARRAEIEVTKLVGGSNAYVRRPFLYLGGLYGLLGAALAALWLIALATALEPWLLQLARLYGSGFQLVGLTTEELGGLLGGGTLLGLLGAWIGAARHLSRIEPRQ
jgi:cell division transport system permease protein